MDYEWEKLVNGKSEIDADNLNTLADGINENEKKIKAIKDILDNGGTFPEYLTNFFKEIPEGSNIDDITEPGCYLITEEQSYMYGTAIIRWFMFVNESVYTRHEDGTSYDTSTTYQTRWYFDADAYNAGDMICDVRIEKRYLKYIGGWSDWETIYATPQYVNEQIAKIPTGGGGSEFKLLTEITADGETMYWTITKDADGNDINVHDVFIEINHADESGYQSIWINRKREFVRQKVPKGYVEPIYISLQSNLLSGIIGRHSAGVNASNTIFYSNIVSYNAITKIKTGGYGTSVLPVGTTIKIYAR